MIKEIYAISALLVSTLFMMIGTGVGVMLIPLRASAEGWSSTEIAWIGTSYAVAFTIGGLVTPILVKRVGHIRSFAAIQSLLGMSLLLHTLIVDPIAWCFIRALGGMTLVGGYMIIESWLNERSNNASRGRIFSAYMIVSMTGVAVGQYLVPFGSITTAQLFIVGSVAFSISMLPISLSTAQAPQPLTSVIVDPVALFKRSPAAMAGSFLAGVIFSNWSYFGPIYGKAMNFSITGIATMLTLTMIGGMLFQFPFGRLSDRIDRRYVMALVGGAGTVISATMVLSAPMLSAPGNSLYIFLGMFSLGSVMFPMYALNVAHANDFAKPEEFVQVSGGLLIVYGIGSMAGPQFGGRLIDAVGPDGFFVAMGLAYAVYGLYALWRSFRKDAIAPAMRPDFKIVPMSPTQTPETAVIYAPLQEAK